MIKGASIKKGSQISLRPLKMAATHFPTWYSSIIGVNGLNFSVRDGKRWIPVAIATELYFHGIIRVCVERKTNKRRKCFCIEVFGRLVPLSFDISAFTPAAYQRGSLPRPCKEISS